MGAESDHSWVPAGDLSASQATECEPGSLVFWTDKDGRSVSCGIVFGWPFGNDQLTYIFVVRSPQRPIGTVIEAKDFRRPVAALAIRPRIDVDFERVSQGLGGVGSAVFRVDGNVALVGQYSTPARQMFALIDPASWTAQEGYDADGCPVPWRLSISLGISETFILPVGA